MMTSVHQSVRNCTKFRCRLIESLKETLSEPLHNQNVVV
ncbi:Protein of unknown function [Pyronema omphalodes CBS 100304]|uniref:Uncharacterized protein n=1 Tax=Pyronema omphalodes (strain CBS 100304) TaxID=1076935 RepID=U4KYI5_PYROM|nr:Protein of unknown function [Pyronema omphalodes CBS 100304]